MNKTYEKLYFDRNAEPITVNEACQACARNNTISTMKFMYLNLNEAIYKCSAASCMYPFRNFIFKDIKTKRLYRYQFEPKTNVECSTEPVVQVFEGNPPTTITPIAVSKQSGKMELQKCLKFREKMIPKISKFDDVNHLLDVYNKSAKKSTKESQKLNMIAVTNPLNLIQCLNRTNMKLISNEDAT